MKIENRTFDVSIPTADGENIAELISIEIPMEWDAEIQEWLMTEEGLQKVEETKARHMGLMLPSEIHALRQRLNLSQKEISEALQIGEKTWSPWENGRLRPSRSINLLLRALNDGKITIDYLKTAARSSARIPNAANGAAS
jgi:DNA-binding transcriptional regulator YiaG